MFHKALAKIESFENQMQFSKLLIEIHMNMANIYESIGNYSVCTMHLEKIVTIAKTLYGPLDPFVSAYLNQLGLMYYKEQKYVTALSAFMECLRIRTNCNKNNKSQIVAVMYNLATVYKAMGMTEEALTIYRKVLNYERQIMKEEEGRSQPKDLIHTLRHIFQIYKEQGIPKDGLEYLREAVDLCRHYKDKINTTLGQSTFFLMGEYLTLNQKVTDGFRYYCEGCELFCGVDDDILYAAGENGLRIILAQLCTDEKIFPIHAAAA
jgi:tetratricopeptide (TPR) repeat protein